MTTKVVLLASLASLAVTVRAMALEPKCESFTSAYADSGEATQSYLYEAEAMFGQLNKARVVAGYQPVRWIGKYDVEHIYSLCASKPNQPFFWAVQSEYQYRAYLNHVMNFVEGSSRLHG